MTGRLINRTWAAADPAAAGTHVVGYYVNLRAARGLIAVRRGGNYTLAAVFGGTVGDTDDLELIPLEGWKRSSRGDICADLTELVTEVSEESDVTQA